MSSAELTVVSLSTSCWGAEESLLTLLSRVPGRAQVVAPAGELLDRAAAGGHVVQELRDPTVLRLRELGITRGAAQSGAATAAAAARLATLPLWSRSPVVSFSMWLHLPLALAGRARRRRVVLDLHDGPFTRPGAAVQSAATFAAHRSVAVSRTALDHVGRWPHRRIAVVPRPVDIPWDLAAATPDRPASTGPLRLVVVGRLDKEKRVDVALDAHRILLDERLTVDLEVIGSPLRGSISLETFRERWPQAHFTGRLDHRTTLEHVAQADVLVSTASGEAFGRTVAEAALLGVPSVVLGGGPAEVVQHGRTGIVAPGQDADALAGALRELVHQRDRLAALGTAARHDVGERCDPTSVAAHWWKAVTT